MGVITSKYHGIHDIGRATHLISSTFNHIDSRLVLTDLFENAFWHAIFRGTVQAMSHKKSPLWLPSRALRGIAWIIQNKSPAKSSFRKRLLHRPIASYCSVACTVCPPPQEPFYRPIRLDHSVLDHSHSYTLFIPVLGIVREPTVWCCITSPPSLKKTLTAGYGGRVRRGS